MASSVDSRAALTAMCSVLTAYTSASGVSTATFAASIASQFSADTSLTAAEKAILTALSTGLSSVTPSSSIHNSNIGGGLDMRTVFGAMVSAVTAWSSASSATTGNFATQLSSMIAKDSGLTSVESGLVTLLTSALASATPAGTAHLQV